MQFYTRFFFTRKFYFLFTCSILNSIKCSHYFTLTLFMILKYLSEFIAAYQYSWKISQVSIFPVNEKPEYLLLNNTPRHWSVLLIYSTSVNSRKYAEQPLMWVMNDDDSKINVTAILIYPPGLFLQISTMHLKIQVFFKKFQNPINRIKSLVCPRCIGGGVNVIGWE